MFDGRHEASASIRKDVPGFHQLQTDIPLEEHPEIQRKFLLLGADHVAAGLDDQH